MSSDLKVQRQEEIRLRLEQLDEIYSRASARLIPKVLEHPGCEVRVVGVPKGLRELEDLWIARYWFNYPAWLVVELESARKRFLKDWRTKDIIASYEIGANNMRFFHGRVIPSVLQSLQALRVYLVYPKKPKSNPNRPRGYKDHGSMPEASAVARRSSDRSAAEAEKVLEAFYERRAHNDLSVATILSMEHAGISTEEIQAQVDAGKISFIEENVDPEYHPSEVVARMKALGVDVQETETPLEAIRRFNAGGNGRSLTDLRLEAEIPELDF